MKAFLLSAGLGTRLLPFTANKPKCLIQIGGKPIILWHIERLKSYGIKELIINLFHEGSQVEEYLGDGAKYEMSIKYIYEKELLGTGGGIGNALGNIGDETFILISGDIWTDFNLSDLCLDAAALAHLVLIENPKNNSKGDMFLDKGRVNCLGQGRSLTFSGLALLDPKLFDKEKKGKYDLWDEILLPAVKKEQVTGELYKGKLVNINTIQDVEKLDAYLSEE